VGSLKTNETDFPYVTLERFGTEKKIFGPDAGLSTRGFAGNGRSPLREPIFRVKIEVNAKTGQVIG
jgi:hypothetical protein